MINKLLPPQPYPFQEIITNYLAIISNGGGFYFLYSNTTTQKFQNNERTD